MAAFTSVLRNVHNKCPFIKFQLNGFIGASTVPFRTYWNKDWKPGPFPKTQEERVAAAKKYGMIPEDYEPHPEGSGYGDYPKFPAVSAEARDQHENYDSQVHKRYYGEPLHIHADILGDTRYNINAKYRYSIPAQVAILTSFLTFLLALYYLGEVFKIQKPMMPKQFPKPGVKHYTFEPAE